ncbi:gp53-like domain-containing protein, partial [Pseudomonas taiwanensis]|uniref:gp53-like domain-containing protein n=1 Tax=Pseudomonas taiwanensis TaxID=470150 RepID=UPI003B8A9642
VSPKKLSAWFSTVVAQATETVAGFAKIASQVQTNAGTDDTTIVTPKKLRNGFAYLMGASGYIAFPSWLGGWIFQWGAGSIVTGATVTVTLPIPFPNAAGRALCCHGSGSGAVPTSIGTLTQTSLTLNMPATNSGTVLFVAIGN